MAESDKADASTGKTKAKTSFLDDDISKDFLSSWKSTGGSDMDFNFEPVAKGNKKAFDFGMDMDFSLDDAFGKMSSFKLDMPDIDFSSSPKKSAVSKEKKSESKPAKESGQEKDDKFTFSFDFDGFGDFSLDDSATKGGKNATEGKTSKQASSLSKIECEDLPNQAASNSEPRKEDATQKEHSKSEVAVDSKHGLSVEQEKSLGASSSKGPSNSTIAIHQQTQTQMPMNKTVPVDALQPDPKCPMAGETDSKISRTRARAHDFSSNPESNPSHKLVDSEEAFVSPKTTKITSAEGVEEDFHFTEKITLKQVSPDVKEQAPLVKVSEEPFASPETDRITTARGMEVDFHLTEEKASKQVFAEVKEQASMVNVSEEAFASPETDRILTARGIEEDFHLTEEKTSKQVFAEVKEQAPMVNISALLGTGSKASDDETCSPNEKIGDGTSEVETLQEEFAAGALLGTDSITTNPDRSSHQCFTEKMKSEEERVAGVSEKLDNHTLTLDTLSSTISKRLNSEVSLNAKLQKSDVKDPLAPSESKPTSAKSMKMRFKLSEANSFSMVRGTNDGAGKKHFILEKSKKGSASLGAADLRNEGNGGKLDGNPSSCAKELMKRDSAVERREKRTDVSRDDDSNESGEIQTKMVVDAVLGDRQAKKDSFHLLDTRKISIDVKPHSIQLPSVVAPEREAKSSNHGSGKLNDKISSISIAQKSNIGQVNRLLSARTDKTVPTLPSLKISRNTVNKQSASSIVQTPKSMVNFEKSARLEEKTKIVSPVNVLRQTPSVTSLKRKPTEVADPQPSKRHLVSESRMSNVSPREVENEVKTRVTSCEGSKKNVTAKNPSPKFDFHLEENMENLGFTLMVESDESVEKAEACAKELDDICSMLKKKHDEAKELLVRALVNNNNLLMLNHPIYEKKILEVQKFASRLMSREQAAGV
ncbi:uncharacterized protein LOC141592878 isoform X2 [Silene latifolia]|uniref:uncharacterized protein LOC141592878 isoform X2 n=1 Tax=Silene latifolia TaxID=37657 RepID=UPI003D77AF27